MKEIQIHFVRNIQNITEFKKIFIYFYFSISTSILKWSACISIRMFLITHICGWTGVRASSWRLFFFTVISPMRCSKNPSLSLSLISWWIFMLLFLIFTIFLLFWTGSIRLVVRTIECLLPMSLFFSCNDLLLIFMVINIKESHTELT